MGQKNGNGPTKGETIQQNGFLQEPETDQKKWESSQKYW